MAWSLSGEILERISKELAPTEVVLPLARDAVSPEAFALLLRALQEIRLLFAKYDGSAVLANQQDKQPPGIVQLLLRDEASSSYDPHELEAVHIARCGQCVPTARRRSGRWARLPRSGEP